MKQERLSVVEGMIDEGSGVGKLTTCHIETH